MLRGTARDGELWKISPYGESPRLICALPDSGYLWGDSVEYLDHETLIFGLAGAGLWTVPERGGRMQQYLKPDNESETWVQPCVLPNTNALLFLEITGGTLEVIADGQRRTLYDFQRDRLGELNISADGSILVSVFAGSLSQGVYRLGFDPESLRVTSDPVLLYPLGDLDITDNGTLIFAPRLIQDPVLRDLVWVNTDGSISEVIARGLPDASHAALSPDGTRAATTIISSASLGSEQAEFDISVIDMMSGARYEIEGTEGADQFVYWSPDAENLIYTIYSAGVRKSMRRSVSGGGQPEVIFEQSLRSRPSDDGQYILGTYGNLMYSTPQEPEPRKFSDMKSFEFDLTSNSGYIAYTPDGASGGIRIQRFPDGGSLTNVTTMDAWGLNWSHDDSKLYFWSQDSFWQVPVDISGLQPIVGTPKRLFIAQETGLHPGRIYGIGTDERFLMLKNPDDLPPPINSITVNVVHGWLQEQHQSKNN